MPQIALIAVLIAIVSGGGGFLVGRETVAAPRPAACPSLDDKKAIEQGQKDINRANHPGSISTQAHGTP